MKERNWMRGYRKIVDRKRIQGEDLQKCWRMKERNWMISKGKL
jgi:hypothetical protein